MQNILSGGILYAREGSDFFRPWTVNTWRYFFENNETRYQQSMTIAMVGLTAILFGGAGAAKLVGVDAVVQRFVAWGFAPWLLPVIGAVEVAGAGLLFWRRTALLGTALLGTVMLGAMAAHLASGAYGAALVPLFGAVMLAGIAERTHDARAFRHVH